MTYIIAEAGLNYNGSAEKAFEFCDVAKNIGANAIKFQILDCEFGASRDCLRKYELKLWEWKAIKNYCDKIKIEFIATPSSIRILEYIQKELKCDKIKIGSDRTDELDLIKLAVEKSNKVLVSNGKCEVKSHPKIIKMFCTSVYPTKFEWINFDNLTEEYEGWSDHTTDFDKKIIEIIKKHKIKYYEKHIKLDTNCVDNSCSIFAKDFKILIEKIRLENNYTDKYFEIEKTWG